MRLLPLCALFAGGCSAGPFFAKDAGHVDSASAIDSPPMIDAPPVDDAQTWSRQIMILSPLGHPPGVPICVVFNADPLLAAHARPDGSDIWFNTFEMAITPFEIVSYSNGTLVAWVQPQEISFTIHYGGTPVVHSNPASTWSEFAGAWHLDEASSPWHDDAAGHDLTPQTGTQSPTPVAGIVGSALQFDGSDDATTAGNPADGSLDFPDTSFTVSAWVNVSSSASGSDAVIDKGSTTSDAGYVMSLGSGTWAMEVSNGTNQRSVVPFGSASTLTGSWHYLVGVVDRLQNSLTTYVDGAAVGFMTVGNQGPIAPQDFSIGSTNSARRFEGIVDEPRVFRGALSATQVKDTYDNVAHPDQYLSIGPERPY